MEKRLLISIRLVNNLNCFKTEIPPIKRDFLFGNMFFVILIYPVIDCVLEYSVDSVVSNTSKILKRKQITTSLNHLISFQSCFQYIKDTKNLRKNGRMRAKYDKWLVLIPFLCYPAIFLISAEIAVYGGY